MTTGDRRGRSAHYSPVMRDRPWYLSQEPSALYARVAAAGYTRLQNGQPPPSPSSGYRGRLAPSPTGYLHVGHARTFWTAFQRAREAGGTLVMRMEDLDPDRSRASLCRGRDRRPALAGHPLAGGPGQGRAIRALRAEQAPRHLPGRVAQAAAPRLPVPLPLLAQGS